MIHVPRRQLWVPPRLRKPTLLPGVIAGGYHSAGGGGGATLALKYTNYDASSSGSHTISTALSVLAGDIIVGIFTFGAGSFTEAQLTPTLTDNGSNSYTRAGFVNVTGMNRCVMCSYSAPIPADIASLTLTLTAGKYIAYVTEGIYVVRGGTAVDAANITTVVNGSLTSFSTSLSSTISIAAGVVLGGGSNNVYKNASNNQLDFTGLTADATELQTQKGTNDGVASASASAGSFTATINGNTSLTGRRSLILCPVY